MYYGDLTEANQTFPDNMRFMAGNATDRQCEYITGWAASDLPVNYLCIGTSLPSGERPCYSHFPPIPCPGGLRLQVNYPSCWSGVTPKDTLSNWASEMAYPTKTADQGPCPASHPVKLQVILLLHLKYGC
jgi:hypothetical protein